MPSRTRGAPKIEIAEQHAPATRGMFWNIAGMFRPEIRTKKSKTVTSNNITASVITEGRASAILPPVQYPTASAASDVAMTMVQTWIPIPKSGISRQAPTSSNAMIVAPAQNDIIQKKIFIPPCWFAALSSGLATSAPPVQFRFPIPKHLTSKFRLYIAFILTFISQPDHKSRQPSVYIGNGIIAKFFSRFGNVSVSAFDVAGLWGQGLPDRFLAKGV